MGTNLYADPEEIRSEVMARIEDWYGPGFCEKGACFYIAHATVAVLCARGHRAIIQAGSMHWRMRPDSAAGSTHFGYEFDLAHPFSKMAIASGTIPEVHIWAALPDYGIMIDFSTAWLRLIAERDHGFTWEAEDPPLYVWGRPPAAAVYRPTIEAIRFVLGFMARLRLNEKKEVDSLVSKD